MRQKLTFVASIIVVLLMASACADTTARVSVSNPFASEASTDTAVAVLGDSTAPEQAQPNEATTTAVDVADTNVETNVESATTSGSWTSPTSVPVPDHSDEHVTTLGLDRDIVDCIIATPDGSPELVEALARRAFNDLSVDEQIAGTKALFECTPSGIAEFLAETLNSGFSNTTTMLPYFLGRCLERELSPSNPERDSLITGWTHMRTALPVPAEHRDIVVFTLTICVPDDVFGEVILGEVGYDAPEFLSSVSSECLEEAVGGDELRLFWEAYVEREHDGAALQQTKVTPGLASALTCASIGVMIAEEAKKDGVDLAPTTIACIDASLSGVNMAPLYLESEDSTEVRGLTSAAIESCLSPAERASRGD